MTIDNDYLKNLGNEGFSYADSHQRYKVQLPLLLSYPSISGSRDPNDLFKDDSQYLAYPSGVHQTMVVANQQDRYGSFTITSSGVFSVYLQVSEYAVDNNPAFIGTPTVVSGEGGSTDLIFASYYEDTPLNPSTYSIPITNNGTHSIVFPFPVTSKAFLVTHSGDTNYSISQLLPRKLVQRYDIEVNSIKAYHVSATLIDTIALQVSDSIVVGPDLIGAKSIDGSKIIDGTVSGVLIANGTVTGNKVLAGTISGVLIAGGTITGNNIAASTISGALIAAGTITADNITTRTITADKIVLSGITADLLGPEAVTAAALASGAVISGKLAANSILANNVTAGVIQGYHVAANTISADKLQVVQLDAIAANMGTLTVNSGITIGTEGYLWAGAGSASAPTTGLKIYTTSGISRLTTFSGGISQIDIGSDGKLYAGSGQTLKLDSTGITFKPAVLGRSFLFGPATPPDVSAFPTYPPVTNLIKFKPYYYTTTAADTTTFYDYNQDVYNFVVGATQRYTKSNAVGNYPYTNENFNGIDAVIRAGWSPSESTVSGFITTHQSSLSLLSKATSYSSFLAETNLQKLQFDSNGTQLTDTSGPMVFSAGSISLQGSTNQLDLDYYGASFTGPVTVNNTLTAGATTVSGTLNVAGTLSSTGAASASNLSGTNTGDQTLPVYGDGADGAVTFDGSSAYSFATYSSAIYTLTRDVWATTISVSSGYTVITAGYRLFATTSINAAGNIHNNGSNGSGAVAGAGGLGGFFKAGGAGAAGLLSASAGAAGTAQATPTANTWVGGVGGRGGQGRLNNIGFNGGQIAPTNATNPANADGGSKVTSNYVNYLTRYVVGATNWQMTPSIGGGGGAKSVTGTAATSGAGGGGGGICFVAAPVITGSGTISANGGSGGNAAGTGGSFGGGGGGGGGVVCVIAKTSAITPTATGGTGGTSVFGTNGTLPVAHASGTNTTATQTLTITPTHALSKGKLYLITVHLNVAAGLGGSGVNSITGYGINWYNLSGSRVEYSTIAAPTRAQETWYGFYSGTEPDLVDSLDIVINLSNINTAARAIMDEISGLELSTAITGNIATNATNSATTLTTTLVTTPTTGNMVYSVFTRSGGTAPVAGAGNVLLNNQAVAPQITSQVSSAQQANVQTHTTAAAVAGFSVELTASIAGASGSDGWAGKVIRIYG